MGDFRQLEVYKRATVLADELREAVLSWSKFDLWTTGVQLVRAVDSIGANIAEGLGRHGQRDEGRFLLIARGSLLETEHWVGRAIERDLLDAKFEERTREVGRLLNGLLRRHQGRI